MGLTRAAFALCILSLTACLSGCAEQKTPEQLLAHAQQLATEKKYRVALIELKSLLQENPNNVEARWLLGTFYLELEDGKSAAKEFRRARDLGVVDDSVVPLLARALLIADDADAVLALNVDGPLSPLSRAEFTATRGLALLARREDD